MNNQWGQFGGVFLAMVGFVASVVQLLTAPPQMRNLSVIILGIALIFLGIAMFGYNSWKRYKANRGLPSLRKLEDLSIGYIPVQATREEISWIAQLEADVYSMDDAIPKDLLLEWYDSNPTGFNILKTKDGMKVGHIDLLPIRPSTLDRFVSGTIKERDIRGDSLYGKSERHLINTLYIESVIVRPPGKYSDGPALLSILTNFIDLVSRVCDPASVDKIYAIAASTKGEGLLGKLGFNSVGSSNERIDHHNLYVANFDELAANLVTRYGPRHDVPTA